MLSMLAVVYATHEELPENRAGLFRAFVSILLEREHLLEQKNQLLTGLQGLAWAMQEQQNEQDDKVQTTLSRTDALKHVNEDVLSGAARANLLDAGDDVRFSHQLLQEYFAALIMKQKLEAGKLDASRLWPAKQIWKPSGWEEAAILLAGLYEPDCTPVLRWLLPVHPEMLARCIQHSGVSYQDAIVAEMRQNWQETWLDCDKWPEPAARASIARAFGILGLDKRKGVGLDLNGLPDIDWVKIPGGSVTLEDDAGIFSVEAFHLARYPVTNAQFQVFIDDPEGYSNPRWWKALDQDPGVSTAPQWSEPNHPRETVSWYEAMAYCAWLSERLGKDIRLPAEWQWQQAACSGRPDYAYPWGKKYQAGFANINETYQNAGPHYLARTTAVGLYPQGHSAQGVSDLCGNVWEWCLNGYKGPTNTQPSGYFRRVVRGSSWVDGRGLARASYRYDNAFPDLRDNDIGFRVCCVSPI